MQTPHILPIVAILSVKFAPVCPARDLRNTMSEYNGTGVRPSRLKAGTHSLHRTTGNWNLFDSFARIAPAKLLCVIRNWSAKRFHALVAKTKSLLLRRHRVKAPLIPQSRLWPAANTKQHFRNPLPTIGPMEPNPETHLARNHLRFLQQRRRNPHRIRMCRKVHR